MSDAKSRLFTPRLGLPRKIFRKVTHCIFDLDGTLLGSESLYHKVIHSICDKYEKKYTKEMEYRLYGGSDHDICKAVVNELKLPISVDEMEYQVTTIFAKMLPAAPFIEGAERLVRHLHDYKVPLALATNSNEQDVRLHSNAKPAFFSLFHHKVTVSDPEVLRAKPHPDIYLVAASRFPEKPKPAMCLVFEDSVRGVHAAKDAGMQVVMTPDPKLDREKTRNATLVLRSLLDFKPELFGLPPFDTKGDNNKGDNKRATKDGTKTGKDDENEEKEISTRITRGRSFEISMFNKILEKNEAIGEKIKAERRSICIKPPPGLEKAPEPNLFISGVVGKRRISVVNQADPYVTHGRKSLDVAKSSAEKSKDEDNIRRKSIGDNINRKGIGDNVHRKGIGNDKVVRKRFQN